MIDLKFYERIHHFFMFSKRCMHHVLLYKCEMSIIYFIHMLPFH